MRQLLQDVMLGQVDRLPTWAAVRWSSSSAGAVRCGTVHGRGRGHTSDRTELTFQGWLPPCSVVHLSTRPGSG